jgi:hypothetical protein
MAEGKAAFIGGVKSPSKTKLKAWSGDNPADDWYKVLAWGINGSGKTFLEVGLLELGYKVFHVDTDFGGNGTRTVKEILKQRGKTELLKNFKGVDLSNYKDMSEFLNDPTIVDIDGSDIHAWAPDWLVWDGAGNYQKNLMAEYILDLDPLIGQGKDVDARREEGLRMELADYGALQMATFRNFGQFLTLHGPDKKWSKLVTMVEGEPRENKVTKEIKAGPDILGGSRNFFNGGFDLVIQTTAKAVLGKDDVVYQYVCHPGKSFTKNRALPVNATEPGDPVALWRKITGRAA